MEQTGKLHILFPDEGTKTCLVLIDSLPECTETGVERLLAQLPQWRRDVALRYKHLTGQRESALGYLALCCALREAFGIEDQPHFSYGEHEKPFLQEYPHIHFSISHCKEAVGCIVSLRPCGLDVERIRTAQPALVAHTMNEEEQRAIAEAIVPEVAFTSLWTRKEAVLKLKGTGVAADLQKALMPTEMAGISVRTVVKDAYVYSFCGAEG